MNDDMDFPTRVIIHKKDRINYILDGLASFYAIPREAIGKRYRNRKKHNRKRIAIKLLVDVADCNFRETVEALGGTNPNCVWIPYQSIKDDLSCTYGDEAIKELKAEYNNALKFLRL